MHRKESKYLHLLEEASSNGVAATLSTIQVGCIGFIDTRSLQPFWGAEGAPILFTLLGIRMASCS